LTLRRHTRSEPVLVDAHGRLPTLTLAEARSYVGSPEELTTDGIPAKPRKRKTC